jgi:putative tryptophan/tyrosine transport system substrate-binding protein
MKRIWIDSFGISLKSALRNLKFAILLGAMLFALCFSAEAQQAGKIPRIGYLGNRSSSVDSYSREAFQQGLRGLGYVEGENILIEYRYAEGKFERLPELAEELVRLKVDVIIVSGGTSTVLRIKKVTATVPIVFPLASDPVRDGLVASLARPGGNLTGLSSVSQDLAGKRLELLKETIPKLIRVAVLIDPNDASNVAIAKEIEADAKPVGVQLYSLEARGPAEIESAIRSAVRAKVGAVLVIPTGLLNNHRKRIADLAINNRLPTMFATGQFMDAGGLMSYGPDYADLHRRAATYVDKILKGTKSADLPVERPMKFELVINLKTAKQIGLKIPPNVLARADRVIR